MPVALSRSWKEEFAFAAAEKRDETLYREKTARVEEQQRKRRDEDRIEGQKSESETLTVIETVLATQEELASFRVQLDEYDTKTVEALMEKQELIDAARDRIDGLLDQAQVLPDGRRVFKSMDGQRVVDEHGQDVLPETIDPNDIDDKKPKWETFKDALDEGNRLLEERAQLLTFQEKLDEARDRLDSGQISKKELEGIKSDLAAEMPDAVREKLGIEQPKTDAAPKHELAANETVQPPNMDNLMQQTGFAPLTPKR